MEPTIMYSKSSKHRVLSAQYTGQHHLEIGLPKGPSTLVELTCFVLDEKYIQGGTEHDLISGQKVEEL